jgi:hypothetical protein
MNPFPEEYEFIDLFETYPNVLDPDSPFFYNHLTYKLERENGTIYFGLEPGCHAARFFWTDTRTTLRTPRRGRPVGA